MTETTKTPAAPKAPKAVPTPAEALATAIENMEAAVAAYVDSDPIATGREFTSAGFRVVTSGGSLLKLVRP